MSLSWWQLPGPSRFVDQVVQDLQDGKNVVICLPEHMPEGLHRAIRMAVERYESWPWTTISVADTQPGRPVRLLAQRFLYDEESSVQHVADLARSDAFMGRIVWVDDLCASSWDAWHGFLLDYEHVSRSLPAIHRTVLCIPLRGLLTAYVPQAGICLALHRWQGMVSSFDILLYSASLLPDDCGLSSIQRQVVVNTAAQLALWDPTVAEHLLRQPLAELLNPRSALATFAAHRGWNEAQAQAREWARGTIDSLDGVTHIHSAVLLYADPNRELERRIWSGHVGILLPYVEEQRRELLSKLRGHLTLPYAVGGGQIIEQDVDLEIGHIYAQLKGLLRSGVQHPSLALESMINLVSKLRAIRNALAHLQCVEDDLLRAL